MNAGTNQTDDADRSVRKVIYLRLPIRLHEQVTAEAKRTAVTVNQLVCGWIEEHFAIPRQVECDGCHRMFDRDEMMELKLLDDERFGNIVYFCDACSESDEWLISVDGTRSQRRHIAFPVPCDHCHRLFDRSTLIPGEVDEGDSKSDELICQECWRAGYRGDGMFTTPSPESEEEIDWTAPGATFSPSPEAEEDDEDP